MAKKTETSVEEKLRALFDLQLIDSRIDQIRSIRGELPLEVEDLENEITELNKKLEDHQEEIKESKEGIKFEENSIATAKESHKKYVGDLKKVLTNVKTRGTWGEYQLGNILEQILTPDQYAKNVKPKESSGEIVEYAVRLPGHGNSDGPVLKSIREIVFMTCRYTCFVYWPRA
jgi:DNA anti-recombination protein RmuC